MRNQVQETIDWRTATPKELDGRRCILMTSTGTIIDGRLKAHHPHDGHQATRFTLDETEETLKGLRILSISPKHHTAILQPRIKTLTILKG